MRGADPKFIKIIFDMGAANVIYLSPGAEELNELPVIRKCVMEYRQNSPVVKKDTLLFVKIFSASPDWEGNKFNPALHLGQIGFCSFPMIVDEKFVSKRRMLGMKFLISTLQRMAAARETWIHHHKIPYFVVSSGRKGSDTAVPYLQKLEKDIFLNKIPSGKRTALMLCEALKHGEDCHY
jgi:hypothetical protein